jgi:hypothetical protein
MFGDQGWYHSRPGKYDYGAVDIWYLSMKDADLQRLEVGSAGAGAEADRPTTYVRQWRLLGSET